MAARRNRGIRDWFFTVVGSGALVAYVLTNPEPNAAVIIVLGVFAGAPGMTALADFFLRSRKDER